MLACTAMLVGCSDDAIDNIAQENNEVQTKTKGYLSISIASGTSSSRALMDNSNGDGDGSADDSYHYNAGTADENKVNEILVVITATNNSVEYAKLYSTSATSQSGVENFSKLNEYYVMDQPLEVLTGEYKALVILNPNSGIKDLYSAATEGQAEGQTDKSLVADIKNYRINENPATGQTYDAAMDLVTKGSTSTKRDNFMMANRTYGQAETIRVDITNNGPDNPAGEDTFIQVERVISKITFRPTVMEQISGASLTEEQRTNVYKVPFTHYTVEYQSVPVTIDGTATTLKKYVLTDGNTFVWSADGNNFYDVTASTNEETGEKTYTATATTKTTTGAVLYAERTETTTTENWYVKLERYALINLSKDLYAVRHKANNDYSTITEMSILGSNEYLVDPVTEVKNDVQWGDDGSWPTGAEYDSWFFNPWNSVQTHIANPTATTLDVPFANLVAPTSLDQPQDVTGEDHNKYPTSGIDYNSIGWHLNYCFENAVSQTMQTVGLTTAIVFEAQIYEYDETTKGLVPMSKPLYQYKGSLFTSISDIKTLYNYTEGDWANINEGSPAADLEELGIKIYKGNKCYYYTSQIKHFDDGNNTINGFMEFAIMRNNIYSLAVRGIETIGDANLNDFTPGDMDESASAYIQVNAEILPWIVRFTDIEF